MRYSDSFHGEVEKMVRRVFPGIKQSNTWAMCQIQLHKDCSALHGFSDICYWFDKNLVCWECREILERRKSQNQPEGIVYLIGNTEVGLYKIGLSRNLKNRYRAISTKLPFRVEIIHQIEAYDLSAAEKRLHLFYKQNNTNGEWFSLSLEDVAFIQCIKCFDLGSFKDENGCKIDI